MENNKHLLDLVAVESTYAFTNNDYTDELTNEIMDYLRNKLNFDLIPKNLKNIDVEKTALGVKPTKEIKELSPIEQKVYDIFHDPIKRENFSKSYAKVISDNLKRYPGKK